MPAWSDNDQHDPGITLLQLLTWALIALAFAIGMGAYRRRRRRSLVES